MHPHHPSLFTSLSPRDSKKCFSFPLTNCGEVSFSSLFPSIHVHTSGSGIPAAPPTLSSCSLFHSLIFSSAPSGQPFLPWTFISPAGKGDKVRRKQVSPFLLQEHQQREWGLVCNTIYLSYSKIILESKGAIFTHLDAILALVLQHYHNCIVEKVLPAYSASPASHPCPLFSKVKMPGLGWDSGWG